MNFIAFSIQAEQKMSEYHAVDIEEARRFGFPRWTISLE